jgi:hypothetical protein
MYGVMRFWLERGVDGFRVDALRQLVKDEDLRDNPPNPDERGARSRTMPCSRSTPRTGPRCTRWSARCEVCSRSMATGS